MLIKNCDLLLTNLRPALEICENDWEILTPDLLVVKNSSQVWSGLSRSRRRHDATNQND
jgi:hypothetical protein